MRAGAIVVAKSGKVDGEIYQCCRQALKRGHVFLSVKRSNYSILKVVCPCDPMRTQGNSFFNFGSDDGVCTSERCPYLTGALSADFTLPVTIPVNTCAAPELFRQHLPRLKKLRQTRYPPTSHQSRLNHVPRPWPSSPPSQPPRGAPSPGLPFATLLQARRSPRRWRMTWTAAAD